MDGRPYQRLASASHCDADFAGCQTISRCTSGVFLAIEGPNSCFPVGHGSKKQHVTSNSTTEAEINAGSHGLRQVGLPGSIIFEVIQGLDIRTDKCETSAANLRWSPPLSCCWRLRAAFWNRDQLGSNC